MLELSRCYWKIEGKWHYFLSVYLTWDDIKGHGYIWKGRSEIGKNGELKLKEFCVYVCMCVCVRDEKTWNIKPKDTNYIYFLIRKVLKLWNKWNKNKYLICSYLWYGTWEYFNSLCIQYNTWKNLILFHIRSLLLFIYLSIYLSIYIYIYIVKLWFTTMFFIDFNSVSNLIVFCSIFSLYVYGI